MTPFSLILLFAELYSAIHHLSHGSCVLYTHTIFICKYHITRMSIRLVSMVEQYKKNKAAPTHKSNNNNHKEDVL